MNSLNVQSPPRTLPYRIVHRIIRDIKKIFGLESYLKNEDRLVLEHIVLPYFLSDKICHDILFIGCHWYTRGYNKWFENGGKNYWTIEIDPSRKRYGAKQHIVDGMQAIGRHFDPGSLDLILCNGVFGWGLDAKQDVEAAFEGCFNCLRPTGVLVIGWDDIDERRPFPLDQCQSLRKFERFIFPPLAVATYVTATTYHHTYSFYARPMAAERDLSR